MTPELITGINGIQRNERGNFEIKYKDYSGKECKQGFIYFIGAIQFIKYFPNSIIKPFNEQN